MTRKKGAFGNIMQVTNMPEVHRAEKYKLRAMEGKV